MQLKPGIRPKLREGWADWHCQPDKTWMTMILDALTACSIVESDSFTSTPCYLSINWKTRYRDGRLCTGASRWQTRPNNVVWHPTGAATWQTGRNICIIFDSGSLPYLNALENAIVFKGAVQMSRFTLLTYAQAEGIFMATTIYIHTCRLLTIFPVNTILGCDWCNYFLGDGPDAVADAIWEPVSVPQAFFIHKLTADKPPPGANNSNMLIS